MNKYFNNNNKHMKKILKIIAIIIFLIGLAIICHKIALKTIEINGENFKQSIAEERYYYNKYCSGERYNIDPLMCEAVYNELKNYKWIN
jgi:uncharacterized protein YxeA